MNKKNLLIIGLLLASSAALAEESLLDSAGKQVLKNAATKVLPTEAVDAVEKAESAKKTLDTVSTVTGAIKGSDGLTGIAEKVATDAAKEKLLDSVPESAKESVKTLVSDKKALKKLKDKLPASTSSAAKTVKDKAKKEIAKKAVSELLK